MLIADWILWINLVIFVHNGQINTENRLNMRQNVTGETQIPLDKARKIIYFCK